jgi:hypothetical protein
VSYRQINENKMNMNFKPNRKSRSISLIKMALLFLIAFVTNGVYAQSNDNARANIGLVYPVSSNGTRAPRDTNSFSLNLIAGVSAAERGISLAGLSNVVRQDARGLQIAGFSNNVGKNADGVLLAGFMNTSGNGKGLALAGFTNFARNSSGTQVAGFLNKAGNVSTLQLAGFMNLAGNLKGAQVGGFMNIAKRSNGTQVGFINIADSARTQVGIINIAKNNEKSLALMTDENRTALLDFNSGGKILYGILGIGYNFKNKKDKYAFETGLGVHIINTRFFLVNTELVSGGLESFKGGENFKSSIRLMPAIKIANSIEIFGGPSFNYMNTNTDEGKSMVTKYTSSWTRNNGRDLYGFYFGYTAGIKALF